MKVPLAQAWMEREDALDLQAEIDLCETYGTAEVEDARQYREQLYHDLMMDSEQDDFDDYWDESFLYSSTIG